MYKIINTTKKKAYKVGESTQGKRKQYGKSKRAEAQKRKLEKETGDKYKTKIIKEFDSKKEAYDYENKLIERTKRLYEKHGYRALEGNKNNH